MSMLEKYIADFNAKEEMFSPRPRIVTFPLTSAHKKMLRERVECELSPENLCCDGEASPAYVRTQGKFLRAVLNDLEQL